MLWPGPRYFGNRFPNGNPSCRPSFQRLFVAVASYLCATRVHKEVRINTRAVLSHDLCGGIIHRGNFCGRMRPGSVLRYNRHALDVQIALREGDFDVMFLEVVVDRHVQFVPQAAIQC